MGGVRGRDSELAGGAIICKDKPPPASAKALAPPPEAEGEMIDAIAAAINAKAAMFAPYPALWNAFAEEVVGELYCI